MIVYKITNLVTGKCYVGQTRQKLSTRWRQHGSTASNSVGLKGAVVKYGREAFSVEVLFEAKDQTTLDLKEVFYIKEFNCLVPNGYNLTTGGEGGYTRSEETRRKLSDAGRGKGRPHTAASRAKLSASHRGAKNPMFGSRLSEEHRAKISASLTGRPRPQSVKDKIKASHLKRLSA